jgi:hypothetical protein
MVEIKIGDCPMKFYFHLQTVVYEKNKIKKKEERGPILSW